MMFGNMPRCISGKVGPLRLSANGPDWRGVRRYARRRYINISTPMPRLEGTCGKTFRVRVESAVAAVLARMGGDEGRFRTNA
jgi:hypothetical protein